MATTRLPISWRKRQRQLTRRLSRMCFKSWMRTPVRNMIPRRSSKSLVTTPTSNDCLPASLLLFGKHRDELLTRMLVAIEARERSPGQGARKRGSEENAGLPLPEHLGSNYLLLSTLL